MSYLTISRLLSVNEKRDQQQETANLKLIAIGALKQFTCANYS